MALLRSSAIPMLLSRLPFRSRPDGLRSSFAAAARRWARVLLQSEAGLRRVGVLVTGLRRLGGVDVTGLRSVGVTELRRDNKLLGLCLLLLPLK